MVGEHAVNTCARFFTSFYNLDSDFVMLHGTPYWTDLFVRHFLFESDQSIDADDLLFFVRKKLIKGSTRFLMKFEVLIFCFIFCCTGIEVFFSLTF